jgi:hypothetical protein
MEDASAPSMQGKNKQKERYVNALYCGTYRQSWGNTIAQLVRVETDANSGVVV